MHKSSIYLPDELKGALGDLAHRSGRSEAELIRSAIERMLTVAGGVVTAQAPATACPFDPPCVVGVGMGPGDPGDVTATALTTLLAAGRVLVITTDLRSVGRAEMVIRSIAPSARVTRIPFAISADPAGRRASLHAVVDAAIAGSDAGELVAVGLLGDPTQWTIFPELARLIRAERPSLRVEAVAGITAYQSVASRVAARLGGAGTGMVVVDNIADLDRHLASRDVSVVLYKASTDAEQVRATASRHGRAALVGELTGLPGERLSGLDDLGPGPISYLATVVFPAEAHDRVAAAP